MKKTIKYIFAIAVASMALASCENFLDTTSYTERNTSNFPASSEDAIQLVTGIYSTLNLDLRENSGTFYMMQANLCSDDQFGGGGMDDSEAQAWDHLMYNDINAQGDFWTSCYQGIGRANMAIANLDKVEDEDLRNQLLGEAYILRSWFYFELTQMCEVVPLVTTVPESVSEAADYPALSSVEEIYGFIAASLKKAVDIMPSTPYGSVLTGKGHVSKWVAEGLLARVYLFYTGFYSDKNGENITALPLVDLENGGLINETVSKQYVVNALEDCIKNSGHSLVPDYRCLWGYSNKYTKADYPFMADCDYTWYADNQNPEQMFNICAAIGDAQYNRFMLYNGLRTFDSGDYEPVFPMTRGYGFGTVNPALWNQWLADEPTDIRRMGSIWNVWEEALDINKYQFGAESQMEESGMWQKKYQAFASHINGKYVFDSVSYLYAGKDLGRKKSPADVTLLRYADILLMHSELTQTVDGINQVRSRAKLTPIGSYSLQAIQKERRYEFAFEGLRWGDMRRWGKAYCINALESQLNQKIWNNGLETVMKDQGAGYRARYEATYGFRPYPGTEISLSDGVLSQKQGWDNSAQYTSWK